LIFLLNTEKLSIKDELKKFKDENTKEKVPNDELIISEIYANNVSTNYFNLSAILRILK
jgi:hypothetical protein